ncbi:MAG: hypothetical protein AAF587_18295 [Bacteroidota bacterium]
MDLQAFKDSLSQSSPPRGLSANLQALWEDGREDWQAAHDLVDSAPGQEAAWVHAYLHR